MKKHSPPPLLSIVLEITIIVEMVLYLASKVKIGERFKSVVKKNPVVVLPGFLTGDWSTLTLRNFLTETGFRCYGWNCGINTEYSDRLYTILQGHIKDIYRENGQKIILVGHSAGGLYACELGRDLPDYIEKVITIGTPQSCGFFGVTMWLHGIHRLLFKKGIREKLGEDVIQRLSVLPPVNTVSIASVTDSVVSFKSSIIKKTSKSKTVLTWGSHCGMLFNIGVLNALYKELTGEYTEG